MEHKNVSDLLAVIEKLELPTHSYSAMCNSLGLSALMRIAAMRKRRATKRDGSPLATQCHGRFDDEPRREAPWGLETRDADKEAQAVAGLYAYCYDRVNTLTRNPYELPFQIEQTAEFATSLLQNADPSAESVKLIMELTGMSKKEATNAVAEELREQNSLMLGFIPEATSDIKHMSRAEPPPDSELPPELYATLVGKVQAAYSRQQGFLIKSLMRGYNEAATDITLIRADIETLSTL